MTGGGAETGFQRPASGGAGPRGEEGWPPPPPIGAPPPNPPPCPPPPPPPPPRANASAVSPPVRAAAVAKTIMVLRNIGDTPFDATSSIRLKTQSGPFTKVWTNGSMKIAIRCIQY